MNKEPPIRSRDKLRLLATAMVSLSVSDGAALFVAGAGYAIAVHYAVQAHHKSQYAQSGVQIAEVYGDAPAAAYWQHEYDDAANEALVWILASGVCTALVAKKYAGSVGRRCVAGRTAYVQGTTTETAPAVEPPVPDSYWQPS